ncbi:hypothetical protein F5882DRAFT_108345 [Hyaloscypha sp. PMI_1271]|nr:hypothetical protein F5882DRAFT_108345 [Hyaloscypha sp. PMI_1271]
MLNSLDFQERTIRRQHLGEIRTKKETFKWIWGSEIKVWLSSSVPLFWILGKPASGKSTVMDHLSRSKQSEELLQSYISEEWVVVHHFFDFRGREGMRNNFSGFLRSLLFQLLSWLPESIAEVRKLGWNQEEKFHQWSTTELLAAFDVVLATASRPVFLLLDGLDEYGGDKFELCSFIKSFPSTRMKVCIASRPDPPFPDAFHAVAQIRMDRLNAPGILAFVTETLKEFCCPSDFANDTELSEIAEEITERANGVFLWARFAIFEVIDGHTKGETPVEWEARLNQVPRELEDVYSRILAARSPSEKSLTSRLLQFICYAQRTLAMQELFVAMSLTTPSAQRLPQSNTAPVDPHELHIFRKKILASSGGVIETLEMSHESNTVEIVQIIHRTVEFYLDKRGWSDLRVTGEDLARPHYLWLQACTKLLQIVDLASALNDPEVQGGPSFESYANVAESSLELSLVRQIHALELQRSKSNGSKFTSKALLRYVLLFLPEHAERLESGTMTSSHEMLRNVLSQHFVDGHILAWEEGRCPCCDAPGVSGEFRQSLRPSPLMLAIAHGMTLFIRDSLYTRGSGFVVPQQPQKGALLNSLARMTRLAVGGYLPKDDAKPLSVTPLAIEAASSFPTPPRRAILETLLAVEPIVGDETFRIALRTATLEVIQILLDKGSTSSGQLLFLSSVDYHLHFTSEDQKLKKKFRFLPLWEVARREDKEDTESVIDLFLQRGQDINAQCGPFGTALHSFLKNVHESYGGYQSEVLQALVCKGADVNAEGPKGKPLEYIWMLANTSGHGKVKYVRKYQKLLRDLINLGAVNMREDPNGMVPSVERMTSWPTSRYSDYEEYKRFYLNGPLPQE